MILEMLAQFAPVILIVVFLLGMVIGLPITWALGITTIVTVAIDPGVTFAVVGQKLFSSADNFAMLAVPGFFLAGDIMTAGGLSKKLVEFADSLVGWVTGGISLVAIVSCAFFAAISGSSAATTAAIGGIMYPEMIKRGYPSDYSTAVQAVGGTLGIIIPPSIVFVIYGSTNGVSISKLLISGMLPGILTAIALCIYGYLVAKKANFPKSFQDFSIKRVLKSLKGAIWALMMPLIILGGIYGGIFTPTESAMVACAYGLIVSFFVTRELTVKNFLDVVSKTAASTANVTVMFLAAQVFGFLIAYYDITTTIANFFVAVSPNWIIFMALVFFLLVITGMFMEVGATNVILSPLLAPVAAAFGIDPIHFGLVFVFLLALGQATPPFGSTMFIACGISGERVAAVIKRLLPFVLVEYACALVFTYVPWFSTFLPNLMT